MIKEHIMCKHVKALYYILTHNCVLNLSNKSYFYFPGADFSKDG